MKQLWCQCATGVPEVSRVKLTLLVCSHAGLGVLHVHHDAALPVSLRVNGHLITCKTRCFLFRHRFPGIGRSHGLALLTGRSAGIV